MRVLQNYQRFYSSESEEARTETELEILKVLKDRFPEAEHLDVKEGGQSCGEVFEVFVSTKEFKGKKFVFNRTK